MASLRWYIPASCLTGTLSFDRLSNGSLHGSILSLSRREVFIIERGLNSTNCMRMLGKWHIRKNLSQVSLHVMHILQLLICGKGFAKDIMHSQESWKGTHDGSLLTDHAASYIAGIAMEGAADTQSNTLAAFVKVGLKTISCCDSTCF